MTQEPEKTTPLEPAMAHHDHALAGGLLEQVVVGGDLARLTPENRMRYYAAVCESVGLNPLTRPFEYITLNGKLTLYAKRDCTDQLRKIHGVSITDLIDQHLDGDLFVVTAKARDRDGRVDASKGAVSLKGLTGEARANAVMKTETKAKRRVTLSLCGLGMLDETETDSIPGAVVGEPETRTGDAPSSAGPMTPPFQNVPGDSPEEDRIFLIRRIKALAQDSKLPAKTRADLAVKFFGVPSPDLETVDIGQLSALYRELLG
jgi:hypothetical protein